jgi:hypothetical protein
MVIGNVLGADNETTNWNVVKPAFPSNPETSVIDAVTARIAQVSTAEPLPALPAKSVTPLPLTVIS